jgi:hypothetical protein
MFAATFDPTHLLILIVGAAVVVAAIAAIVVGVVRGITRNQKGEA